MYTINFFKRCGYTFTLSGLIILIIGTLSIPNQQSTIIPQNDESPQQASNRIAAEYNQILIHSKGFLLAMIGTGLISLGIVCIIIIVKCFDDAEPINQPQARIQPEASILAAPKSILKVKPEVKSDIKPEVNPELKPQPKIRQLLQDMYSAPRPHITIIKAPVVPVAPHKNEAIDHII
jgi:hypothetical protein